VFAASRDLWKEATGACPSIAGNVNNASIADSSCIPRHTASPLQSKSLMLSQRGIWLLRSLCRLSLVWFSIPLARMWVMTRGQRTPVVAVYTCEWSIDVLLYVYCRFYLPHSSLIRGFRILRPVSVECGCCVGIAMPRFGRGALGGVHFVGPA
jgi:hypothetical protein